MRIQLLGPFVAALVFAGCAADPESTTPGQSLAEPSGTSAPVSPTPDWPSLIDVTPASGSTPVPPQFEALPGATAYFGLIDQAAFRIEVPARWNGDLVLWAHGVRGFGPEVSVDSPPPALRRALVTQGYAWGASSFSENGYVPGIATNDTLKLKRHFSEQFGRPRRTYIAGSSLGGHVVVLSLELFPHEYDGGLSLCGAVAGQEEIDYLLAWSLAAEAITGHQFPLDQGPEKVTGVLDSQILPALGPADAPIQAGKAFESVIRNLTGGPRPFFVEGYRKAYPSNFGLVTGDPGRVMAISRAATNEGVDYQVEPGFGFDSGTLNRSVRRLAADPALRNPATHPDTSPTTGQLRDPLLTLHETGDLTVPISAEQSYRKKAEAAGAGDLLVQRIIRSGSHCEFSDAELTAAWNDLARWVADSTRPAGDDVLSGLSDAGRTFTDPLRPDDPGTR